MMVRLKILLMRKKTDNLMMTTKNTFNTIILLISVVLRLRVRYARILWIKVTVPMDSSANSPTDHKNFV